MPGGYSDGGAYLRPHSSAANINPTLGLILLSVFVLFATYIALRVRYELKKPEPRIDRKFRRFPEEQKDVSPSQLDEDH
jgi:hypothetical protein